jgi:hypothetical protein
MPVRMINFVKEPPPPRSQRSIIQQTEEWQDFVMACGAGLKPQEYISIEFPADHPVRKKLAHPIENFLHATKGKIKELGLPYDAYIKNGIVYVVGRGVLS